MTHPFDEPLERTNDRWRNRRAMAWRSWWAAVVETAFLVGVLAWGRAEALGEASALIYASYGVWAAVIGAYVGFSTWDDVRRMTGGRYVVGDHGRPESG